MTIQLQRLEGFYWVARTQGYARAARAFPYPITQPGVHQQVKRLEADLGVPLFERVGKDRVILTPAGQALYAFVSPFLEQLPGVVQALRGGTVGGTLRIHAAAHLLRHLMPQWLRRLQAKRPDIEVALAEMKTADLGLLRSGETDLFVDHLDEVPEDVEVLEVARVRAFIALPSSHPLAKRKALQLEDLKDEGFIGYNADRKLRDLQLRALSLHGISPRRMYSADTSETILGFVAAGLGFSLVPSLLPHGPKEAGVVAHRLMRPPAEFPIYAAWRKGGPPNPLVEAALSFAPKPSPVGVAAAGP
ncbi:MAG TPA: LysR family transcriptional regulator [Myxococcaceae bacterium]|nr:LysR family transcriptional regulator [Myxococcaceae bacterium]